MSLTVCALALIAALSMGLAISFWRHSRQIATERNDLEAVGRLVENVFRIAEEGETLSVREVIDRGSAMLRLQLVDQPRLRARLQHTMGSIYLNLQEPEPARRQLEEAFELRRNLLGENALDTLRSRSNLAVALAFQGVYEEDASEAEEILVKSEAEAKAALRAARQGLGKDSPEVVAFLNNLVKVFCLKEDWSAADLPSAEALSGANRSLAESDLERAIAIAQRAVVRAEQEFHDEAAELYGKAIDLHRRYRGTTYPAIATLLNNQAVTFKAEGKFAAARESYQQALRILRLFGEDDPTLARTLYNLGRLESQGGDLGAARNHYQEALAIIEARSGKEHFYAMVIAIRLASVLAGEGQHETVVTLLRERLHLWRHSHPGDRRLAQAESILGASLLAQTQKTRSD